MTEFELISHFLKVVAHEMGHNMGMLHDFDSEHGGLNGPCDGTGIMSYGSAPNVWSTCSKNDFLALYNEIISSNSVYWCLDSKLLLTWILILSNLNLKYFQSNRLSKRMWRNSTRTYNSPTPNYGRTATTNRMWISPMGQ